MRYSASPATVALRAGLGVTAEVSSAGRGHALPCAAAGVAGTRLPVALRVYLPRDRGHLVAGRQGATAAPPWHREAFQTLPFDIFTVGQSYFNEHRPFIGVKK